jgi:hypothetical protein
MAGVNLERSSKMILEPLDYAQPTTYQRTLALPAMICGLISGPLGYGFAFPASYSGSEQTKELLGILAIIGPLVCAFIFALVVKIRLPIMSPRRDHMFSVIGMVAPILWGVAIFAFLALALQYGT